jgi:hypothetical protein
VALTELGVLPSLEASFGSSELTMSLGRVLEQWLNSTYGLYFLIRTVFV